MTKSTQETNPYELGLNRNEANFVPLSPVSFLVRSANVYPDKPAVIHGERLYSYREFYARSRRLASSLEQRGITTGDCVAIIAPNVPAMLEAHFGVPMLGAVLNSINTRLDAASIAFMLEHGQAKALIADRELSGEVKKALARLEREIFLVEINDPLARGGEGLGALDYESFLEEGDPEYEPRLPSDEWQAISLLYTSGTTGNPKGVVYSHRGACLNALGNAISFGLTADSVYLWTLPMFHCDGWTYTWAVTAVGGTHVCLRKVTPEMVYQEIARSRVTHMCGAPVVLTMLAHAPKDLKQAFKHEVQIATGGAAPPSAVIEAMEEAGFRVLHLYGLTESYGPAALCAWQEEWDGLGLMERSTRMARQGVRYLTLEGSRVIDPESGRELPWDGKSMGELLIRGNTIMKGYLKNPQATEKALAEGWLHTGDLAVRHSDGYIEIKDRSKDIIISGGENISSLEVEELLYRHPKVLEAAVVARPDEKWGETPCAFVTLKEGECVAEAEIIAFCRDNMAHFKAPKRIVFGPLPKTSTGKIQKFLLREQAKSL